VHPNATDVDPQWYAQAVQRTMRILAYCTLVASFHAATEAAAQPQVAVTTGTATFNVFFRSTPIGFEQTEVTREPGGWVISSRGDLSQPIDLQNQLFEVHYDEQWRPRNLRIMGSRANAPFSLITKFEAGGAVNEVEESGERRTHTDPMEPDAVVLPNYFFGGFEALAIRLAGAEPGDELPVYVAPHGSVRARVGQVLPQQIQSGSVLINATLYRVSLLYADGPLVVEVSTDVAHRLVRVTIPAAAIDVAREDISSVDARIRRTTHPGDEDVRVRSEGFSLAVTLTVPLNHPRPEDGWPAVLLVPGAGGADRDGTVSGVPVLGQLAGALAEAGFLVARYDRRGVGQSGGRAESAGFEAYGDDGRTMVRYLDRRDDVDGDRITVLGYAEGGWAAIQIAVRERRADDLVLVGSPATTGAELLLEQQRGELDRLGSAGSERTERVALQQRIHSAVLGESSWEGVPEEMRKQADTSSFRSFLEFDTEDVLRRARQPVLVLQGELDGRIGMHHAHRLLELSQARRRDATSELVVLEGLDHLLVERADGDTDSYRILQEQLLSPLFIDRLTEWLNRPRTR
jgi:pimeloyl-ACP methyl ester carboxylesterase